MAETTQRNQTIIRLGDKQSGLLSLTQAQNGFYFGTETDLIDDELGYVKFLQNSGSSLHTARALDAFFGTMLKYAVVDRSGKLVFDCKEGGGSELHLRRQKLEFIVLRTCTRNAQELADIRFVYKHTPQDVLVVLRDLFCAMKQDQEECPHSQG